jgi:hypothetical protein
MTTATTSSTSCDRLCRKTNALCSALNTNRSPNCTADSQAKPPAAHLSAEPAIPDDFEPEKPVCGILSIARSGGGLGLSVEDTFEARFFRELAVPLAVGALGIYFALVPKTGFWGNRGNRLLGQEPRMA